MEVFVSGVVFGSKPCNILVTPSGDRFSLHGNIDPSLFGVMVDVEGEEVLSFCMVGKAVKIRTIQQAALWWLDRTLQMVGSFADASAIEMRSEPPRYRIGLTATFPSTGWTDLQLVRTNPIADSHAIFALVARPPAVTAPRPLQEQQLVQTVGDVTEPAIRSLSIIALHGVFDFPADAGPWWEGGFAKGIGTGQRAGGGTPWPWSGARMMNLNQSASATPAIDTQCVASLVGQKLRVIRPGEVGDAMYDTSRITVTVDANQRITNVTIG